MNAVFLTNDAREEAGGAFYSQKILIEALQKKGHHVTLVATKKRGGERPQPFEVLFLETRFGDLGRIIQLVRLVKNRSADLLIANMKPQIILAAFAGFLVPRKQVGVFGIFRMGDHHLKLGGKIRYYPLRWFLGLLFQRLDGLIAISRFVSEDVRKTYFLKTLPFALYNPFDVEEIRRKADEFDPGFKKKTIVNVGRMVHQKAQHHLIEMARELLKTRNDWHLLIIGQDGVNRKRIESMIKEYALEEYVELPGHKNNPFPYIKHASVFVLTSLHEGFGRVVAESMALDVPVIAFRSQGGGHVELLDEGRGFLVPYADAPALARQVSAILDGEESVKTTVVKAGAFVASLTPESRAAELLRFISQSRR